VDPGILETPVPTLLLQPLLENAFKHGVERSTVPVTIDVAARREGGSLGVTVSNTGSSISEDHREGVGIHNCRERLSIIYGGAATLRLEGEADRVTARVLIPFTGGAA